MDEEDKSSEIYPTALNLFRSSFLMEVQDHGSDFWYRYTDLKKSRHRFCRFCEMSVVRFCSPSFPRVTIVRNYVCLLRNPIPTHSQCGYTYPRSPYLVTQDPIQPWAYRGYKCCVPLTLDRWKFSQKSWTTPYPQPHSPPHQSTSHHTSWSSSP